MLYVIFIFEAPSPFLPFCFILNDFLMRVNSKCCKVEMWDFMTVIISKAIIIIVLLNTLI